MFTYFLTGKQSLSRENFSEILMKNFAYLLIGVSFFAFQINAGATELCGDLDNAFGPYDYTDPRYKRDLGYVERAHFNSDVERLIRGISTRRIGAEIDYVLRAFPNHHRALDAMARLAINRNNSRPDGARFTLECYFDRARRFQPKDAMVPLIYGMYFYRIGKLDQALEKFKESERLQPDNSNTNYNLGLIYFAKKDYESARTYARKAYALGFELPGLKQKLVAAGEWKDN
jgi:tetratricopeptide (TPR) repeat protein